MPRLQFLLFSRTVRRRSPWRSRRRRCRRWHHWKTCRVAGRMRFRAAVLPCEEILPKWCCFSLVDPCPVLTYSDLLSLYFPQGVIMSSVFNQPHPCVQHKSTSSNIPSSYGQRLLVAHETGFMFLEGYTGKMLRQQSLSLALRWIGGRGAQISSHQVGQTQHRMISSQNRILCFFVFIIREPLALENFVHQISPGFEFLSNTTVDFRSKQEPVNPGSLDA